MSHDSQNGTLSIDGYVDRHGNIQTEGIEKMKADFAIEMVTTPKFKIQSKDRQLKTKLDTENVRIANLSGEDLEREFSHLVDEIKIRLSNDKNFMEEVERLMKSKKANLQEEIREEETYNKKEVVVEEQQQRKLSRMARDAVKKVEKEVTFDFVLDELMEEAVEKNFLRILKLRKINSMFYLKILKLLKKS